MEITHEVLVQAGKRWLQKHCRVILTEFRCAVSEEPDVIGFGNRGTWVVECKTSRSDFHADKKKAHRRMAHLSLGDHRYFLTPRGLLTDSDLPDDWGLIEFRESRHAVGYYIKQIRPCDNRELELRDVNAVLRNEHTVLVSALWRAMEAFPLLRPLGMGEERTARDILQAGGFHEDAACGSCDGPLDQHKDAICDRCEMELWNDQKKLLGQFMKERGLHQDSDWSHQDTTAWQAYRRASWAKGKGQGHGTETD